MFSVEVQKVARASGNFARVRKFRDDARDGRFRGDGVFAAKEGATMKNGSWRSVLWASFVLLGCGGPNAGVTAPAEGPASKKTQSTEGAELAEGAESTEGAELTEGAQSTEGAELTEGAESTAVPPVATPSPSGKVFETSLMLAQVLREQALNGAVALYDAETRRLLCSAEGACDVALGPASTFKIPHTLIGLELGELKSAEHFFKWDGKAYSMEAWNRDHTLRTAMEVSCVPCFQQLARRIGEKRMSAALTKLDYGNATLGAPIDKFWLEGGLRITPRQQIQFLYQLQKRALPFRAEVMETTIDIIPKAVGEGTILRGKTGMLGSDPPVGWYVGWLEWEHGVTYFATALHGENERDKLLEARRAVTVEALRRFTKIASLK